MEFISEELIEKVVKQFEENKELFEEKVNELGKTQPNILAYVISDEFNILTDEEKSFLLYSTTVLTTAIFENHVDISIITQEKIGEVEEMNWEVFQTQKGSFRERLDIFYEGYPQEDLLAFVEDSLFVEEEDDNEDDKMTKVGRDVIFVALRTIIDVLSLKS